MKNKKHIDYLTGEEKERYLEARAFALGLAISLSYTLEDLIEKYDGLPELFGEIGKRAKLFSESCNKLRDRYFGTKVAKRVYGNEEATEQSQEYMWENVELIEEYYKKFLSMNEEKHNQIRQIVYGN